MCTWACLLQTSGVFSVEVNVFEYLKVKVYSKQGAVECYPVAHILHKAICCFFSQPHIWICRCWMWTETTCTRLKVPFQVKILTGNPYQCCWLHRHWSITWKKKREVSQNVLYCNQNKLRGKTGLKHNALNVDMSFLVVTLMLCSISLPLVAKNHNVEVSKVYP